LYGLISVSSSLSFACHTFHAPKRSKPSKLWRRHTRDAEV
jgi:hypothetical protein